MVLESAFGTFVALDILQVGINDPHVEVVVVVVVAGGSSNGST
jgi:hypothetical protein